MDSNEIIVYCINTAVLVGVITLVVKILNTSRDVKKILKSIKNIEDKMNKENEKDA